jgi:hypothetical protein
MLLALLFGCPSGPEGDPSLVILTPEDGSTVCGDPLHVEVQVENFELVPLVEGEEPEPGTGHVDVWLNGQSAGMTELEAFDLEGVEPGEYQLRADLVLADHETLDPYVGDFVYVTVDPAACP